MNIKNISIALLLGMLVATTTLLGMSYFSVGVFSKENLLETPLSAPTSRPLGKPVKEGVYTIEGYLSSLRAEPDYTGTVTIMKTGDIYKLEWSIAPQIQVGIGILEEGILSVGYMDVTNEIINDTGVVSYRVVEDGKLEGTWGSVLGQETGRELLTWKSFY